MNNYFIILAAGKSKRFNGKIPKQFSKYKGVATYQHSINKAKESKLFKKIILVINKKHRKFIKYINDKNIKIIYGGPERHISSLNALKYISKYKPNNVFIHDAARPNFTLRLLKKLNLNIKKYIGVVPYIRPTDTIINNYKNNNYEILQRKNIMFNQTPQCFNFKYLYKYSKINNDTVTDEATLFLKNNSKIKFLKGEENNFKITTLSDLDKLNVKTSYGIGFDIHRLIKNKKLYLGGVKVPFHSGLQGHSDGDVVLHSIIDGLLGATGKKDIGTLFPSNKPKFKNIRSPKMLRTILNKIKKDGYIIKNIDINLICENPKVSKYRQKIILSLVNLLSLDKEQINLKGKTVEKLGLIGKEKAIACEAIVAINRYV